MLILPKTFIPMFKTFLNMFGVGTDMDAEVNVKTIKMKTIPMLSPLVQTADYCKQTFKLGLSDLTGLS